MSDKKMEIVPPGASAPAEPEFISDLSAQPAFELHLDQKRMTADIGRIAEGEIFHCEFCGKQFPVWPVKKLANHMTTDHVGTLTIQSIQAYLVLAMDTFTDTHGAFINSQFLVRIAMRRRAWELGYLTQVAGQVTN